MNLRERFASMDRQLKLFLGGIVCLGIASGIFETTFNNFLSDTYNLAANQRSWLELPREMPGFLTSLFAGLLFFLSETRVAAVAALTAALGMFGLAVWGWTWGPMLGFLVAWSAGTHLMMPVNSSIGLHLSQAGKQGRRLGQVRGVGLASILIGCGAVWMLHDLFHGGFRSTFIAAGVVALVASVFFWRMNLPGAHLKRPRFVIKARYRLYYWLAFLFGARKQVFITFGPWVLVKVFDQPVKVMAGLWATAAVIGIVFQPMLGRVVDRFGERRVLMADSVLVATVCLGYGFSFLLGDRQLILGILYACFVGDQLLFGVNIARSTYLAKIAEKTEDVSATLSMGITIDHAVSMSVPLLGGYIWSRYGYSMVFVGAACVAVVMFVSTSFLPVFRNEDA